MFNVKNVSKKLSTKVVAVGTGVATLVFPVICHAADGAVTPDITSTITTAVNGCVTQTLACIAAIAPIGMTIFAACFCYRKAIGFFKQTASK